MPTTGTIQATVKRGATPLAGRTVAITSLDQTKITVSPTSAVSDSLGHVSATATAVGPAATDVAVRFTVDGIHADCLVSVVAASAPAPDADTPARLLYDMAAAGYTQSANALQYDVRYGRTAGTSGRIAALSEAMGRSVPDLAAPTSGDQPLLIGSDDTDYAVSFVGDGRYMTTGSNAAFDLSAVDGTFVVVGSLTENFAGAIQQSDFTAGCIMPFAGDGSTPVRLYRFASGAAAAQSAGVAASASRRAYVLTHGRTHAAVISVLPAAPAALRPAINGGNNYLDPLPAGGYALTAGRVASGNNAKGDLRYWGWFPGSLPDAALAVLWSYLQATHSCVSAPVSSSDVALGDSISDGTGASDAEATSFRALGRARLASAQPSANWVSVNVATSGRQLRALAADAPTLFPALASLSTANDVGTLLMGVNDLLFGGRTAADVTADLQTCITVWLAASPRRRLVWIPILASDSTGPGGTFNADRATVESNMRTWIAADSDRAARCRIPATSGAPWTAGSMVTGGTYSADGLHPNNAGHAAIDAVVGPLLVALA